VHHLYIYFTDIVSSIIHYGNYENHVNNAMQHLFIQMIISRTYYLFSSVKVHMWPICTITRTMWTMPCGIYLSKWLLTGHIMSLVVLKYICVLSLIFVFLSMMHHLKEKHILYTVTPKIPFYLNPSWTYG